MSHLTKEGSDLRSFFNYLYIEKGLSKNTVDAYKNDLKDFLSWLNKINIQDYKKVTETEINEYVAHLFKNGLKSSSINRLIENSDMSLISIRETSKYLVGLLVFLGLLGTFWGLLKTIGSVGNVII